MKKLFIGLFITALLLLPVFSGLQSLSAQEKSKGQQESPQDESSFWSMFRSAFSRPEPAEKSGKGVTQVAGVRGVGDDAKLKEKYDWDSVTWMEQYQLNESTAKQFLETRKLGPYKK
jgi:hypothetical protein